MMRVRSKILVPVERAHRVLFVRLRAGSFAASLACYALVLLALGRELGVSGNYFVIIPIIVAALGYGLLGGLVAGSLGLPANLVLFSIIGHPEFSPESKPIAEFFGIVVGFSLGYLSDYFRMLQSEIRRRGQVEDSLRRALADRELLLRELDHRVKNNLNVIRSLVRLQRSRNPDPAFREAADELERRIFAISLAHEKLHREEGDGRIDAADYLEALVGSLVEAWRDREVEIGTWIRAGGLQLDPDAATNLGIILNEALTNAAKHSGRGPRGIMVTFDRHGDQARLVVENDGEAAPPAEEARGGLGMKLLASLSEKLGGHGSLRAGPGGRGAVFELVFPWPGA